jgi:hypothetical protein
MTKYEVLKQVKDEINIAQNLIASFDNGVSSACWHIKRAVDLLFIDSQDKNSSFTSLLSDLGSYTETQKQKVITTWQKLLEYCEISRSQPAYSANFSSSDCVFLLNIVRDLCYLEFAKLKNELPFIQRLFYSPGLILIAYIPIVSLLILYIYFGTINPLRWIHNPMDDFIIEFTKQDFGILKLNKSLSDGPLKINKIYYDSGFGTHANSFIKVRLNKKAKKLLGACGIDDATQGKGSIRCIIGANGRQLYASQIITGGSQPSEFEVNVDGIEHLEFIVSGGPDGITSDHANWVNLRLK